MSALSRPVGPSFNPKNMKSIFSPTLLRCYPSSAAKTARLGIDDPDVRSIPVKILSPSTTIIERMLPPLFAGQRAEESFRRGRCLGSFTRWPWPGLSLPVLHRFSPAGYNVKVEDTSEGVAKHQLQRQLATIPSVQSKSNCAICTITCILACLRGCQRSGPATCHQHQRDRL